MSVLLLPASLAGMALGILAGDPAEGGSSPAAVALVASGIIAVLALIASRAGERVRPGTLQALGLASALALGLAVGSWRSASVVLPTGPGTVSAFIGDRELAVVGTVVDDPRPRLDRQQVVLEALELTGKPVRGRLLAWLPRALDLASGDRVAFRARLEEPQDFDGFAYRAFLARQGIGAIARSFDARRFNHADNGLLDASVRLRRTLVEGLNTIVPEPEASLGAGILLGIRTSIDPAVSDAFATAGLTHVVAISGWNIAIVAALVARLLEGLRRRRGSRVVVPLLMMAAIGGYVVLVGSSPSVIRAALMAGALILGRQAGSRAHALSALMLAALLMLVVAPAVLWDVGFQLSLLATAGLIAFGASIEGRLSRWPGWLREPLALTLAAQLATLPVILATFERVSLVAPLANVVVVPLVPMVMLATALAAPVGAIGAGMHVPLLTDAAAWFAGGSAWLGLRLMIVAGSAAAALPLAALPLAAPGWLALAWYPALVLIWRRAGHDEAAQLSGGGPVVFAPLGLQEPSRSRALLAGAGSVAGRLLGSLARPRRALLALTAVLGITTLGTLPDGRLHLVMLDVRQGDGILVVSPTGRTLLIDAGPDPDQTLRQLGSALPWTHRTIDTVILTHPHQDHVGGFPEVLRRFEVLTIFDSGRPYRNPTYDRFLELARAEPGARFLMARAGQRLDLDAQTVFEIWYPGSGDAAAPLLTRDINNASVVGLLRFGAFSALLTGDAKAPVEELLEARGLVQPIDVLKVGHHGSNSGTTPRFLSALRPTAGLISVGTGNPYGHPGRTTLRTLEAAGVTILRTDLDGRVEIETDGAAWTVSASGRLVARHIARGAAGEPIRTGTAATTGSPQTAPISASSIRRWRFPIARRRVGSWRRAGCRPRSSCIRRVWHGSPPRPLDWLQRPGSRSTWASSRPPPCSMTSTSSRRERGAASMA